MLEENVNNLIERVHRELGLTCIIITHDIVGSFQLADKIAFLDEGEIRAEGTPEELKEVDHPVLRKFLEFSFVSAHQALHQVDINPPKAGGEDEGGCR
jgi:phospholipid/cholesterol/gamma-HCH transport system ATP-binding protein